MDTMSISLAGMSAATVGVTTVADNVANSNSKGYKSKRPDFEENLEGGVTLSGLTESEEGGSPDASNVNLDTDNLDVAKQIAKTVRASSGGFCCVKGIGVALAERGMTQVSMNLVDYEKNSLYRVLEMIRMEAKRWGVQVVETEVYGMIPANAILESAAYYLQIAGFNPEQVLELRLLEMMGDKAE